MSKSESSRNTRVIVLALIVCTIAIVSAIQWPRIESAYAKYKSEKEWNDRAEQSGETEAGTRQGVLSDEFAAIENGEGCSQQEGWGGAVWLRNLKADAPILVYVNVRTIEKEIWPGKPIAVLGWSDRKQQVEVEAGGRYKLGCQGQFRNRNTGRKTDYEYTILSAEVNEKDSPASQNPASPPEANDGSASREPEGTSDEYPSTSSTTDCDVCAVYYGERKGGLECIRIEADGTFKHFWRCTDPGPANYGTWSLKTYQGQKIVALEIPGDENKGCWQRDDDCRLAPSRNGAGKRSVQWKDRIYLEK